MKKLILSVIVCLVLTISQTSAQVRSKQLNIRTLVYDEINAVRVPGVNVRIFDKVFKNI